MVMKTTSKMMMMITGTAGLVECMLLKPDKQTNRQTLRQRKPFRARTLPLQISGPGLQRPRRSPESRTY